MLNTLRRFGQNNSVSSVIALLGVSLASVALDTSAQAAEPEVFEEIYVTARKRSESVQTVPIAVTALSAQAVADRGALRVRDLQYATPNIIFPFAENNSLTIITVRGINSQPRQNVGTDAGLGVYVDGVVMGRLTSFNQEVYDIERVEFLRGPQGTLFGKNSTTGVINIITKMPSLDKVTAAAGAKISDFDETNFFGYLSGPLIENQLGASVSMFRNKRSGYMFNLATGNKIGTDDSYGGRMKLHYTDGEALQVTLAADYLKDDSVSPGPQRTVGPFSTTEKYTVNFDNEPISAREIGGVSLTVDYDLGVNARLTSISAYRMADNDRTADADATPLAQQTSTQVSDQDQWSQELRIASTEKNFIEYVAGVYYYHQKIYGSTTGTIAGLGAASIYGTVKTSSYAAFANLDFNLTDNLIFTAGIRYTREEKDLDYQQDGIFPFIPFLPLEHDQLNDNDISPTFSLRWMPTDDAMLYATVSRGYKSGGWNLEPIVSPIINTFELTRFTAENLMNYEIGAKTAWLDNRLILNMSVFQYDYNNIQISQRVELPPPYSPGTFANLVTNAAKATSRGFELEAQIRPTANLQITGGIGYVDATYDQYMDGAVDFAGNSLNNAPKWTTNMSVQYVTPIGNMGSLMFRVDHNYIGESFTERANDPLQSTPGYNLVNARVRYTDPSDRFDFTVYSTNILGNTYLETRASNATGTIQTITYGRPRVVGAEAVVRF